MKNWKSIAGIVIVIAVIVTILAMNKKKLSAVAAGGVKDVFYVSVDKASKQKLESVFSLTGTVAANNDVNILSETAGKVKQIFFKVGDYKTANSVLAQVDDELKIAAFKSAEANYEKSKKDYERFKNLFELNSATDAQLDGARLAFSVAEAQYIVAKRQLEDTKIKTPISGYITARNIDVGSMVQGAPQPTFIANIVDISRLKVKLNVAEKYAFALKQGDKVKVTADVFPGVSFSGRIESISAKSDEAHTFPVEIIIENQGKNQLKAGVFARVEFSSLKNTESIVIPRQALVGSIKDPQVYIVENGIARQRKIVLGGESNTFVQVMQGINEGETIVVNGQNILVDNTKVEILNK